MVEISFTYLPKKKKKTRVIAPYFLGKKGRVSAEIILFNKTVQNGKTLKYYTSLESSHKLQLIGGNPIYTSPK